MARGRASKEPRPTPRDSALPPASTAHARAAVRSVRRAARAVPARIACLEESTAASLLLADQRRSGARRAHHVADRLGSPDCRVRHLDRPGSPG
ncbi:MULTISPECIES: lasso peptide biosynthesis protein [Streptomyces]|uniref:lasso peptide biosynthesis protein n=1 Tax=Streptomyces TaxID=1883 RepID=UPI0027E24F4B|nr:lasso peptide biosynthesis protein [Streptomyces sp. CJ_13]